MLEIEKLSIRYKNTGKQALNNVSFSVETGEIIVLLGPSGCGKTTLLNYVAGLLSPDEIEAEGEILWKNHLASVTIKNDNITVRMVFQDPTLLPWRKVSGNIALGIEEDLDKSAIKERVDEAARMVGLDGYESYYPHQLSVGMRQRVNFARALVCNPDLLLLDEPFSALDVNRKKKLQNAFLEIIRKRKMTAIFVTHSIEEALEIGDKIYVFFDGKKIKKGFYVNKFKGVNKDDIYIDATKYLENC